MAEPTMILDRRFSSEAAVAPPWSDVARLLEEAEMFWLSTVRGDGRPHVTPLPAMWLDDALHFCTGSDEQKTRNMEADPRCVLTTGCNAFRSGTDVVVEGTAVRVADRSLLERLAAMWNSKLEWPFEAVDGGFRERSSVIAGEEFAARATALVFAVRPAKILVFGKGDSFSQTRFSF